VAEDLAGSGEVLVIDEALLRMRRLWSQTMRPDAIAGDDGRRVELSHVLVVDAVARLSPAEVTVRAIADQLDVDPSTASRLIDSAARAGWVTAHASTDDRRRRVVELTRPGELLQREAGEFRRRYLVDLLASWPSSDRQAFARLLDAFSLAFAAAPPHP
jgi:DNA-binding MarR family transcriptional regulator